MIVFLLLAVIVLALTVLAMGSAIGELRRQVDALAERMPVAFNARRCRACGCTDDMACMSGCWWVEYDLCSSCDDDAAVSSSLEGRE